MTTRYIQRCVQCGSKYTYQGSGPGCDDQFNDGKWCPLCKAQVVEALQRTRPRQFECRYRNVGELGNWWTEVEFAELTFETLLTWERENYEEAKRLRSNNMGLYMQRIWPGRFNATFDRMQSIREVRGRGRFDRYNFRLTTWPARKVDNLPEEGVSIELPMEWDVIEGKWTGNLW